MGPEIVVVSGLPRSGTSLMMQMLTNGGLEVVTDHIRTADVDNPRGYYEYEQVKKIKDDSSWLPDTRGKAFKMISQLLYDLPASEKYRIVFMERDLDEILISQEKMLKRLNRKPAPADKIGRSYASHLDRLRQWLARQEHMAVLHVSYNDLIDQPAAEAARIGAFLGDGLDVEKMAGTVDPSLYRNRNTGTETT
jgi:sulfotransferase family protein